MANALANLFTDIADSIRSKTGSTEKLSPSEFPSQIDSIQGGGGAEGCVTVTFMNGANVLLTRPVYIGDDCPDPVTQGRIETPTKESTAQYNYTYSGWTSVDGGTADSSILKNITEDKILYSAFTETVRTYTVNFYDGATLLETQQIVYGGSSTYTYKKDGYSFEGWTPTPTNITGDLDCYGSWVESYSFAEASWEYIAQISESGKAAETFSVGDTRTEDGITYVIADFNYDILAEDNSKTAGITIIVRQPDTTSIDMMGGDRSSWLVSHLYTHIYENILNNMPVALKSVIKPVTKISHKVATTYKHILTSNESIWILSCGEIGQRPNSYYTLSDRSQDRPYKLFEDTNYLNCSKSWWTRTPASNQDYYAGFESRKTTPTTRIIQGGYSYARVGFCI